MLYPLQTEPWGALSGLRRPCYFRCMPMERSAWRKDVVKAHLAEGSNSLMRPFPWRAWELTLECGHIEERPARYEKGASDGVRGFARLHHQPERSKVLPAPKAVDCRACRTTWRRAHLT